MPRSRAAAAHLAPLPVEEVQHCPPPIDRVDQFGSAPRPPPPRRAGAERSGHSHHAAPLLLILDREEGAVVVEPRRAGAPRGEVGLPGVARIGEEPLGGLPQQRPLPDPHLLERACGHRDRARAAPPPPDRDRAARLSLSPSRSTSQRLPANVEALKYGESNRPLIVSGRICQMPAPVLVEPVEEPVRRRPHGADQVATRQRGRVQQHPERAMWKGSGRRHTHHCTASRVRSAEDAVVTIVRGRSRTLRLSSRRPGQLLLRR